MTAYNRERYIVEAIESVLKADYKNIELIIVDDRSADDTLTVARNYAVTDNRIKVYRNEKNLGDYPNRNKAASYAAGKYLMYVDSDDTLIVDSITKAVAIMEAHEQVQYGLYSPLKIERPLVIAGKQAVRKHFFEEPFLMYGPVATIIRSDHFKKIGGFPIKYGPANDMYYHLKVAATADLVVLPFELVNYRRHDGQEINNHYAYLYNNYRYLNDAVNELPLALGSREKNWISHKNKRRFIVNLFKFLLKTRQPSKALAAMKASGFNWSDLREGIFSSHPKPEV